jgi:glucose-6-phosphate-specific signal transduction histidine kinase
VEVAVHREADCVRFTIQDDGAGFDTRFVRGLGILGMEERVRRLGGRFQLASQPGRGTRVAAELPLTQLGGAVSCVAQTAAGQPAAFVREPTHPESAV